MRPSFRWVVVAALTGGAGIPLCAQTVSQQGAAVCGPRETRLDAATCAEYRVISDSVKKLHLPLAPLEDKALQGIASESDGAGIITSVRKLAGELEVARGAMGTGSSDKELKAAAVALDAGASANDLARLRSAVPAGRKRTLEVPLTILTQLLAENVHASVAGGDVQYLLQEGVSDLQLQMYRDRVDSQIKLGADPTIIANQLARAPIRIGGK